jgi:hypothetical protein
VKNPSNKLEKNKTGSSLNISLSKKLVTTLLLSIVNQKKKIDSDCLRKRILGIWLYFKTVLTIDALYSCCNYCATPNNNFLIGQLEKQIRNLITQLNSPLINFYFTKIHFYFIICKMFLKFYVRGNWQVCCLFYCLRSCSHNTTQ